MEIRNAQFVGGEKKNLKLSNKIKCFRGLE